jgi:hypothetical protein
MRWYLSLVLVFVSVFTISAQTQDSLSIDSSGALDLYDIDTSKFKQYREVSQYSSQFTNDNNKTKKTSIQLYKAKQSNTIYLIWILVSLALFFLTRLIFARDLQTYFSKLTFLNFDLSVKIKSSEVISIFNILFLLFSVFNISFVVNKIFHFHYHFHINHVLLLIFLFTFFVVLKSLIVIALGVIVDELELALHYVTSFFTSIQTIGISMFPVVMYIAVSTISDVFYLKVYISMMSIVVLVYFLFRWLSTMIFLMYKSPYHFLLYICTCEILVVFLFIKLLTKIAF